jgi:hypothetical protein
MYKGKLRLEHYQAIQRYINQYGKENIEKHLKSIRNDKRIKDLTKRLCFDVMYRSELGSPTCCTIDDIYRYANDDHIYTALKHIIVNEMGVNL